jgi:hypothetical protein
MNPGAGRVSPIEGVALEDLFSKLKRYVRDSEGQGQGQGQEASGPEVAVDLDWQAELGREHGLVMRAPRVEDNRWAEPAQATDENVDPRTAWQAEFIREHGGFRSSRPFHGAPPPAARREEGIRLAPNPAGFDIARVPANFNDYRALVQHVFDAPKRGLAARLSKEPAIRAAFEVWQPGNLQTNLNVTYELFGRISTCMGQIYRFHPAEIGYKANMDGMWGYYVPATRRVYFAELLLHQPAREMVATIVHEQIHKLQDEMVWRLDHRCTQPLTHDERALALYWLREEKVLKHLYAKGFSDMAAGKGDAVYRRIGKEHHAFDTEEYVVPMLEKFFERR